MADAEKVTEEVFRVVVNAEKQYSIWPSWKTTPVGWEDEGKKGTKQECLDYIETVWTDMRPLSLQKFMAQFEDPAKTANKHPIQIPPLPDHQGIDYFHLAQPANDLVQRLQKEQEVIIIRYCDNDKPNVQKLQRAVQNGYVLVKFTSTKGGTELGCNVKNEDPKCTVQFDHANKRVTIRGRLKLDYTPVRLNATVNLDTFKGTGYLEVIEDWKTKTTK